jgi:hypothetical protein
VARAGPGLGGSFVGLGVIQNREPTALEDSCRGPPRCTGATQRNGARAALDSEPPAETCPVRYQGLRLWWAAALGCSDICFATTVISLQSYDKWVERAPSLPLAMRSQASWGKLGAKMLLGDVKMVLSVDDLMSRAEICCPLQTKPGIRQSMILSRQYWWFLKSRLSMPPQLRQARYGCDGRGLHAMVKSFCLDT